MTNKNTSSSCFVREYDGFEGIDRLRRSGGLTDVVNMRLENDKTLKRREAAVRLLSLSSAPRAHYPYSEAEILLLEGRQVILLNISSLEKKEIGTVTANNGDAQFFYYDGKILLIHIISSVRFNYGIAHLYKEINISAYGLSVAGVDVRYYRGDLGLSYGIILIA
jgi:hypothetical protein